MSDMCKLSTTTLQLFLTGALLTAGALAQSGSASAQASAKQAAPPASAQQGSAPSSTTPGAPAAQQSAAPATPVIPGLPTKKDQVSYAIGMNIGKGLHHESIDVDPNIVLSGLKDALGGGKMLMTDEQAQQTLAQLQAEVRQAAEAKRQQEAEANKKAGDAFLAANKNKPGVVALPSGLQYKIIKQGTGPKPTINDNVTVTYRGTTIDGKEFDSTAQHGGEPATFPVKGIIRGWTEALQLMPVGSKFELYLPPDLAYGERGVGADIGPNATLIFDVDLLSVKPAEQPQEQKSEQQKPESQQQPATQQKPATQPSSH